MGIFDRFNLGKQPEKEVVTKKDNGDLVNNVMQFAMETSLPTIKEENTKDWVSYKTDDGEEYPIYLEKLYNNSPTHQAIIDTKSLMVAGDGYTVNKEGMTSEDELNLNTMLNFFDGKNPIELIIKKLSKHYELYGAVALEVIWSLDFSKIVKVNPINPKHIKSGKFEDGEVKEYFYSRDWDNRREEITKIASFDINDKENHRQLMYMGTDMVSNEYYYEPSYLASCNWIYLESQTGLYYSSLMENGFNPSVIVRFFRKPSSLEERDDIVRGLKKSFGGVKNSGKAVVMFSDGKELAPEVEPINVSNLDKQFITIQEHIVQKILTGGKVTTPSLFGIAVPGKLGESDFDVQVDVFNKFVVKPSQNFINLVINKILKVNGYDVKFEITPIELDTIKK